MSMLNYHELTMNEPRDSPQRRKQFLVISAIMVAMTLHAAFNAGVLEAVAIEEGTFPGGEFVYKSMMKDYAASTGALRTVASDLGIVEGGRSNSIFREEEGVPLDTVDFLYSVLLDDRKLIPGGKMRFASGALLPDKSKGEGGKTTKKRLLEMNDYIKEDGGTHSKHIKYEVGSLPKVNAAVTQHPFTGGAWSAILQSYKIVPEFKKYAEGHGESDKSPIVIATCSAKQQMCTYYMPLSKRDKFYMGKMTTEDYSKKFNNVSMMKKSIGGFSLEMIFGGIKKAVGMGGKSSSEKSASDDGDEL